MGACMALPQTVHMLRIDARYVTELQELAAPVFRSLVQRWRRGRDAYIDLPIDRRVLNSLTERATSDGDREPIIDPVKPPDGDAALTAAFL